MQKLFSCAKEARKDNERKDWIKSLSSIVQGAENFAKNFKHLVSLKPNKKIKVRKREFTNCKTHIGFGHKNQESRPV